MASKTNRVEVPEAKAAMDRFKTEVASGYRPACSCLFDCLIDMWSCLQAVIPHIY